MVQYIYKVFANGYTLLEYLLKANIFIYTLPWWICMYTGMQYTHITSSFFQQSNKQLILCEVHVYVLTHYIYNIKVYNLFHMGNALVHFWFDSPIYDHG